jgi:type VI secretion system protein ImpA
MPIDIEALLQPISTDSPSGADLRYKPITDQIKEARRQEDDLAQGVWQREIKTADYVLVLKLTRDVLSKQSKDLQIAAWMTEALLRREGFAGLRQGLELIRGLLENFWDTVYPQIDDDGDLELRATPLSWVGSQLDNAIRSVPVSTAGHTWYQYRESRAIPTEADSNIDQNKMQRRTTALADGGLPPEEFDKGIEATPLAFSQKLYDDLAGLVDYVQQFGEYCDEKFKAAAPDFGPLRTALEEVHQTSRLLLIQKGGLKAPQHEEAEEPVDAGAVDASTEADFSQPSDPGASSLPQKAKRRAAVGLDPSDESDAIDRLLAVARFLRHANPYSPMAYLIPRALRWGELRGIGAFPPPMFLIPPPSETRMELKRLSLEGQWEQVRELAEEAVGQPCGRAWLDLQRYAVMACRFTGAEPVAQAIISGLRSLIADFPQMPTWVLADDTAAANAETLQWLTNESIVAPPPVFEPPPQVPPPAIEWSPPPLPLDSTEAEPAPPDAYELAMAAARSGRIEEAFDILTREISQERSGRARFLRRVQLAQVCLATGNQEIALPILQELSDEIEHRGLEAWEDLETIAQPLALLYKSLPLTDEAADQRRKLYARLCRLDPARALALHR